MKVMLVYNDGKVDQFESKDNPYQEYTHSQLVSFVEEDQNAEEDGGRMRFTVGLEFIPTIDSNNRENPKTRRLCSASFYTTYEHHSAPSIAVVCGMISGLERLVVDGVVIWEGDPGMYMADDSYANELPEMG